MNQEEKIEEMDKRLKVVEGRVCTHFQILSDMDFILRPLVLEFQDNKGYENIVSRMRLDEKGL